MPRVKWFAVCLCVSQIAPLLWMVRAEPQGGGSRSSDKFLFLTGQVVGIDGTPARDPALQVELVCGGRVQQQNRLSEEGHFSFTIEPAAQQGWTDASVGNDGILNRDSHWNSSRDRSGVFASSSFGTFNLSGCVIRLSEGQGYSSTEISLANRSVFDNPDVGVVVVGKPGEQGAAVLSVTTLQAPAKAREAYQKAQRELAGGNPNLGKAARNLRVAVEEYPEYAEAWYQLGEVQLREHKPEDAMESFEKAVSSDARYVEPHLALARMALFNEDWRRAEEMSVEALALSPRSGQAHYFRGLAGYFLGELDKAEESLGWVKANGYAERYPLALFHLAVIHIQTGSLQEAGSEFDDYLRLMPEEQLPPGQKERIQKQLRAWEEQGVWRREPND